MLTERNSGLRPGVSSLVYRAIALVFALVVLVMIFPQVVGLLLLVLLVVIIAVPLARGASGLERLGLPRFIGAPLLLLLWLAVLGGIIALLVPSFIKEGRELVNSLPHTVQSLERTISHATHSHESSLGNGIKKWVDGYTKHPQRLLGPATAVGSTAAGIITGIVAVLLTAVFTAVRPEPLVRGMLSVVPPPRRGHMARLMERLAVAYVGWLRGLLVGMVVLWVVTYGGLTLVHLRYSVVFATVTALAMVVPYFGALLSAIPPILYAVTISPGKALLVALVYVVAHLVEGDLISPLVMARAVKLPPALVAVGVLAVERLFGFVGLIVAVPIIATIKIAVEELWVRPMESAYRLSAETGQAVTEPADHDAVTNGPAIGPLRRWLRQSARGSRR